MSWDEASGGLVGPVSSEFESRRFGIPVHRLQVGRGWNDQFASEQELFDEVRGRLSSLETLLIARADATLVRFAARALPADWRVIPAGTLVYWAIESASFSPVPMPQGWRVSDRITGQELQRIVAESFADYSNHYAANPIIDSGAATSGYQEWAIRTIASAAGRLVSLEDEQGSIGIATLVELQQPDTVEIELAGLLPRAQGRGHYRHLLDAAMEAVWATGRHKMVISTQAQNVRVQRIWAAAGLKPIGAVDTVHAGPRRLWE